MAEKKPVKMSDADLKFFEEMLLEKRRELVTAQSESEKANVFQGQNPSPVMVAILKVLILQLISIRLKPTSRWLLAKVNTSFILKKLSSASRTARSAYARSATS